VKRPRYHNLPGKAPAKSIGDMLDRLRLYYSVKHRNPDAEDESSEVFGADGQVATTAQAKGMNVTCKEIRISKGTVLIYQARRIEARRYGIDVRSPCPHAPRCASFFRAGNLLLTGSACLLFLLCFPVCAVE
jgi:hypothetical protein